MDEKTLEILERAISDVGCWCWWTEQMPEIFQIEFSGVQLFAPPEKPGDALCGVFALQFLNPAMVAFLTARGNRELPADWPKALHEDRIAPFNVDYEHFFLWEWPEEEFWQDYAIEFFAGNYETLTSKPKTSHLVFLSGKVGFAIQAEKMEIANLQGKLNPEEIEKRSRDWWQYWRDYWQAKSSNKPMPEDYACEVTIPIKSN